MHLNLTCSSCSIVSVMWCSVLDDQDCTIHRGYVKIKSMPSSKAAKEGMKLLKRHRIDQAMDGQPMALLHLPI
jgi:hypothetical protein